MSESWDDIAGPVQLKSGIFLTHRTLSRAAFERKGLLLVINLKRVL